MQEKTQHRPLHALHFEELEKIWEADRRIPTVSSRRAWAEARDLNPTNVHSWWYRRRPLARKLKIKIPRDEYELGVGAPPVIPKIEEINAEISTEMNEISGTASSDVESELSSSLPVISDAQTSSSVACALDQPFMAPNPLFKELSSEMSAYIGSSSPVQDFSLPVPSSTSTPSRDSSLPPSSPPPTSTPPPCLLTFPEDMIVEDDKIGAPNCLLGILFIPKVCLLVFMRPDPLPTERQEICSSTSFVPHSFSDRISRIGTLETAKLSSDRVSLPLFPTWCLSGYRISYDGCFVGLCSCFAD